VLEDYDRVFQSLNRRVAMFKEMGDDPIVSAVMNAIKMTLRRVGWYVEPASDSAPDREAAEFVESCMSDASQTWGDTIDQALDMLQYGFQLAEVVYKKREGPKEEAGSKYDDGRIGWRKWVFIAPDSLQPGDEWIFDENGGIQGFRQYDLYRPNAHTVEVPIQKAILFRTTVSRGNPEGRSLLRAMWQPYWFKHNLEEIEAISAERMGAGFPVVYLGSDVAKGTGANSDLMNWREITTNIRVDEQMGLVIDKAKMGAGAEPGKGILFELVSPPGKGVVDFHQTITRHEQRMAMVGLAQFIHLGMSGVGARSLGESSQDFFTLAVSAWADSLADTLNRYAVDRLMKLNHFPGLTDNPKIMHESVSGTNLIQVADYINKLAGSQLITPSQEMETHLRELADLPISELDRVYHDKVMKEKKAAELESKKAAQPPAPSPFAPQPRPMPEAEDDEEEGDDVTSEAPESEAPEIEQNSQRRTFAQSAELLAQEIRAARQALGAETMAVSTRGQDNFAVMALIEKFTDLLNNLSNQAPPTVIVTNEVKPAPVTVVQTAPRFSTEETTIKRGTNGEMLGSVTRVTHQYIDGS